MFPFSPLFSDWSLLILRLALAAIFIAHGWTKMKDLRTTATNFTAMGFRPGVFWGSIAAFLEFFGGITLVLGIFTQIFSALFIGEFFVINLWKLSKKMPFVGGFELDLIILAAVFALFAHGAGAFSLDRSFFPGY